MIFWDKLKIQNATATITAQVTGTSTAPVLNFGDAALKAKTLSLDSGFTIPPNTRFAGSVTLPTGSSITGLVSSDQLTVANANVSASLTAGSLTVTNPVDLPAGSTYNGQPFTLVAQPKFCAGFTFSRKGHSTDNDVWIIPSGFPSGATWSLLLVTGTKQRYICMTVSEHTVTWKANGDKDPHDGTEQHFWHAVWCADNFFGNKSIVVYALQGDHGVSNYQAFIHSQYTISFTTGLNVAAICEGFLKVGNYENVVRVYGTLLSCSSTHMTVIMPPSYDRFLSFGSLYWWANYACNNIPNIKNTNFRYLQYMAQDNSYYDRDQQDIFGHFRQVDLKSSPEDDYPLREPMAFVLTFTTIPGGN